MDFRYQAQAHWIAEPDVELIKSALGEFHSHKHSILDHGLRRGSANKPIDNWYISKLELMQNIAPSISRVGATIQWSADVTEHAHIDQIKDPAQGSNNNNYDPQICRQLDRLEKCRSFELAVSLKDQELPPDPLTGSVDDGPDDDGGNPSAQSVTDYFARSICLSSSAPDTIPLPRRSFSVGGVAINLAYDPNIRRLSIDDTAKLFGLSDL